MASRRSQRNKTTSGPNTEAESSAIEYNQKKNAHRRQANVYDAVAGRVTSHKVFSTPQPYSETSYDKSLAPEEVLFRRQNAPVRYAEHDIYFAGTDSLAPEKLPDSDLLKSAHRYAAAFYEALTREQEAKSGGKKKMRIGGRTVDERSMDETALLAVGILLEEAGREALGKTGDMVFTEGKRKPRTKAQAQVAQGEGEGSQKGPAIERQTDDDEDPGSGSKRAKRRRTSRS